MINFFNKIISDNTNDKKRKFSKSDLSNCQEDLKNQLNALLDLYNDVIGSEKVVLKAARLGALDLLKSEDLAEKTMAFMRLTYEDPTITEIPKIEDIPQIINEIEEYLAELCARRAVEDRLERKINQKIEDRHQDYIKEIRMQVLQEENEYGEDDYIENPQTLKKYAILEKLESKKLTKSIMEILRPDSLEEIIGQEKAIEALKAKLSSPYPQHLILYGPPGVGKTTAARLVLETAKKMQSTPFAKDAPFVEVDGTTLRFDPREIANPLLGSVHDPIYQGSRKDLAEIGIPEPKPGLVTDAHGGILFIDEIGEMDLMLQNKLLKVLEDKRVYFESAYYDPTASNIPKYIKKLFEEGAPADFILIGATTRASYDIVPAVRSRSAEIYFEPLTSEHIEKIVNNGAKKLGVEIEAEIPKLISEYTIEGRKAINILADAYGMALMRVNSDIDDKCDLKVVITVQDVHKVAQISRLTSYTNSKGAPTFEIGKIFGLGVSGYLGSVLEIETAVFKTEQGKGTVRFNDTAGSMAKDSVFNALAVVRKITGEDLSNYDIHVNVIGGGQIDGPSAGMAIVAAIISAVTEKSLRQDVAVTGEISIQGLVKAVGGVFEKAYGAKQSGISTMIIPIENKNDIPEKYLGLDIRPVAKIEEALEILFAKN